MFSINTFVVFVFITYVYVQALPTPNVGIIGGHTISIEKAPYIASLRLNGTIHWCGSSIIHEQFILTAAHCIVPNRKYKVLVGTDKLDEGGNLYNVTQIIVHPKYSNRTNDYDVCVLKLEEKLNFGNTVNSIPLNNGTIKLKRGSMLNTAGWGLTTPNGNLSSVLRQVTVPVVTNKECQRAYVLKPITKRMLCAGGHGRDSCQADSGGPLTFDNVLVGVTSFGLGCGNLPGVYARVSKLVPWILETIGLNL